MGSLLNKKIREAISKDSSAEIRDFSTKLTFLLSWS
jgi:hypothetical protein